MARKSTKKLPEVGSVYSFPLGNGLYSACRVISSFKRENIPVLLLACSRWIGDHAPESVTPEMREILVCNYHNQRNELKLIEIWGKKAPTKDFKQIGVLPPSKEDMELRTCACAGLGHLQFAAREQWRWENDRESLLGEMRAEQQRRTAESLKAQAEFEHELKSLTLEKFANYKFFQDWTDYPSRGAKQASRRALGDLVDQLVKLGPNASVQEKTAAVKSCVESFDGINKKFDDFMDTMIRDDVIDEVERVACAAGLNALDADQLTEWWTV